MSDFVSRVAARAVGQAASAQPRLPALFEPSGPGGGGLEVVEETVTPAASRSPASPVALEAGSALEHPVAAPPGTARPQPGRPARATPARPRHREAYSASDDNLSLAAAGGGGAAAESFVEPTSAERGTGVAPASPLAPVSASPGAAAAAKPVARAAPVASTPPPVARTAAAEQGPVRVHIGRLEVRADLQEAPVPQRARERPRPQPQELSLGDYLRGKRAGS